MRIFQSTLHSIYLLITVYVPVTTLEHLNSFLVFGITTTTTTTTTTTMFHIQSFFA